MLGMATNSSYRERPQSFCHLHHAALVHCIVTLIALYFTVLEPYGLCETPPCCCVRRLTRNEPNDTHTLRGSADGRCRHCCGGEARATETLRRNVGTSGTATKDAWRRGVDEIGQQGGPMRTIDAHTINLKPAGPTNY
jgi:hypothetical protein